MEYAAGGDMYDLIKDGGALSEADARFYFRQLVSALEYCHSHFVVHRDLKLENLLLSESKERVMLADFGLSNRLVPGRPLETLCGSSQYAAPEVLCGDSYLGLASDVWSLGVVLYTFLMGALPFGHCGNDFRDIARAAMTQDFDLEPFLSQGRSPPPLPTFSPSVPRTLLHMLTCFRLSRFVAAHVGSKCRHSSDHSANP